MTSFLRPVKLFFYAILTIISISGKTFAQNLNAKIASDPDLIERILPNGLTYYVRKNHTPLHRVELRLIVKAGSILEDPDQKGLAHFMEHMNFNGTKNFPKNELVRYMETLGLKFGADVNANTSYDRTLYMLSIPTDQPDNLEKGFQVLEDWAHNALLTDQDIDEERGVVLEESRQNKDAANRMFRNYDSLLYNGSRYAASLPIGNDSSIKNFNHNALRRFYHDWYRPDLMAVMVIGDIDTDSAVHMIYNHFAGLQNPQNERPHFYADLPERTQPEAIVTADDEETTGNLYIVFPYKKTTDEVTIGDYRNNVKRRMLFLLLRSRIRDAYKSNDPIAMASLNTVVHGYSAFQLSTKFGNNGPDGNLGVLTNVLLQARNYGFYPSEVELARKAMLNRIEKSYNEGDKKNSNGYFDEYVRNFMNGEPIEGRANEYNYDKQLLPTITPDELKGMLVDWTYGQNILTYITAPDNQIVKLPSDKQLLKMVRDQLNKYVPPLIEKNTTNELITEKPEPGKWVIKKDEPELGATTYILTNGIKITIKRTDFQNDEIKLSGIKKGGKCNYTAKDEINCALAGAVTTVMGYGRFEPTELTRAVEGHTANVSVTMGNITDEVTGNCNVRDFETMLQLIYIKLTAPRKDVFRYDAWKENYKKQVDNIYANPQIFFMDTALRVLYNDDPLYVGIPDAKEIRELHLNELLSIYKNEFSYADGYHFFVVGNIDTNIVIPMLETYLGSLPVSGEPAVYKDNKLRPISGKNKLTVHIGKENKSLILAKYYGTTPYSEKLAMNAQALTEILNIKVQQTLREKMSGIYSGGFNITISKEPYEHYMIDLNLPCGPENVEKLLAAANEEIKKIKETGPDPKDLEIVKTQFIEKNKVDMNDNNFWLTQIKNILFYENSKEYFLNYKSFVENITQGDIQSTANLLFDEKNEFTAILMPEM